MVKRSNSNSKNQIRKIFVFNFVKILFGEHSSSPRRKALKITYIYFLIGSLWILLSEKLVEFLIKEQSIIILVSIVKGWVYVFITSILIFSLIFTEMKKVTESKDKIKKINDELNREKKFMEAIFNSMPGIVYLYDDKSNLVRWNKKYNEMTGFSTKELSGMSLLEWYQGDEKTRKSVLEAIERATNTGFGDVEANLQIKDGTTIPMYLTASPVKIEGKSYFTGIGIDITQRNILNKKLEKYQLLAERANDAMLFLDKEGNILEVNDAAIKIYGYTYKEFLSISIFDLRHVEKPDHIIEQMEIANKEGTIFETIHYLKNGNSMPVEVSSQGTFLGDRRILLSIVRDITERKKAEEEIIYLSYHDQLTGLYNRRFYEEELKRLDTERNMPITVVMADVNGLKLTNDAFGHKAGDMLLEKISNILKRECGANESISRIGGDEFVILLPRTDKKEAIEIVRRINVAIANEKMENVIVSISIGFGVKQDISEDINEVFKKAEANMYRNKLSESSIMRSKTVELIMKSLYEKSNTELVHSKRTSEICKAIAIKLNFEEDDINNIRIAGLMHDIGKIGINENILNKVEKLNSDEWHDIMRHSEVGYQILRSVNEFSKIADYVLEHHESWNGKGYPQGLKGEEIHIEARIIAVADSYDTMISDRTYRRALSEEEAIKEIKRCSGTQFDPDIAKVFVEKVLGKGW
ncbi:PAS domain S-box protein [Clostridium vincentii]|uniref:Cyclic di-GMP phosphodiesterase response regulator RpfG n=1 Tax=Clostridium vincentii TaxID=52704 RepID=A0A2T0BA88_9CLOT|nr:PAS domain S-box protein [Clostridium vincentii]PRR80800.1 Cyclic di-GMP phosphodiesterase response regulator RpfG [Clostridium vincentii]